MWKKDGDKSKLELAADLLDVAIGRQIRKDVFFAKMDLLAQTDENSSYIQDALKWMASHLGEAA